MKFIQKPPALLTSKYNLLYHFQLLREVLITIDAVALLDMESFEITLAIGEQQFILYPTFIQVVADQVLYVDNFAEAVTRFIGWRTYKVKPISLFTDKLAFKQMLSSKGFLTPAYSEKCSSPMKDVIVKLKESSFGLSIYGPFKEARHYSLAPEKGEFYEQFITGQLVKAWFWKNKPVCIEFQAMSTLIGDGKSTIKTLIEAKPGLFNRNVKPEQIEQLLTYYGKSWSTVLKPGETLLIDFRYKPDINPYVQSKDSTLEAITNPYLTNTLKMLGHVIWTLVEKERETGLVYTVDGILVNEQQLWILEANVNPVCHPLVYKAMIQDLKQKGAPAKQTKNRAIGLFSTME